MKKCLFKTAFSFKFEKKTLKFQRVVCFLFLNVCVQIVRKIEIKKKAWDVDVRKRNFLFPTLLYIGLLLPGGNLFLGKKDL